MTIYRMDEEGRTNIFRNIRWIVMIFHILIGILLFGWLAYDQITDLWFTLIIALFYFTFGTYGTFKYFRKLEETWTSTEFEVGDDYIEMRQAHKPDIRILKDEISYVSSHKGVTVHTESIFRSIFIPEKLVGFDEVKSKLADWTSIKYTFNKDSLKLVAPLLVISFGIILSTILVVVTWSIWPLLVALFLFMSRILYFLWLNLKRNDLTRKAKQIKMTFYSFFILLMLYFLVVAVKI